MTKKHQKASSEVMKNTSKVSKTPSKDSKIPEKGNFEKSSINTLNQLETFEVFFITSELAF